MRLTGMWAAEPYGKIVWQEYFTWDRTYLICA